jgi:ABC-type multidrug transport system ATPase subunit
MPASRTEGGQTDILCISDFILKGRIETETYEWEDMSIHVPKFCLRPGEITAVIGGSGSGKSVFLSLVMGCPAFGIGGNVELSEFCMFNKCMQGTALRSVSAMARWRRQVQDFGGLFYLPQTFPVSKTQRIHVDAAMIQVVQALILPVRKSRREVHAAIKESFCEHGLGDALKKNISGLSGGERRRAELLARVVAMKLARRPAVLILDEPTTGFDPANARKFIRDVRTDVDELCRDGVVASTLFSTHEMSCLDDKGEDGGRQVVDKVCIVHRDSEGNGKGNCVVLFDGPPETVWDRFSPNDNNDDKTFTFDGESLFEILKTKTTDEWLRSAPKEDNYVS